MMLSEHAKIRNCVKGMTVVLLKRKNKDAVKNIQLYFISD
jgi:hypothetical protein